MAMRSWLPSLWGEERRGGDPFYQLHREIDRLFDDFMSPARRPVGEGHAIMSPRLDMAESDGSIEVAVDLPGVDEKDIEVTINGDVLTIRGEKKTETEENKKDYHLVERSYGSFQRSVRLPAGIDPEKVTAKFDKGVLRIALEKPQGAESRARRIPVSKAS